jgi:kynurenine formamidase
VQTSYIHGGAWRDPEVDSLSFEPAVSELWKDESVRDSVVGFASINYRLSPYPNHPREPSSPDDPSRNVRYPAHLQDVELALFYLHDRYRIADRYLLVGHSAGATMAFELPSSGASHKIPKPVAILGVAGIYDFEEFIRSHSQIPAYHELMENAFPDRATWKDAGPYTNREHSPAIWELTKMVIISHSDQDELVENGQALSMWNRARSESGTISTHRVTLSLKASGSHNEIWRSGTILARLITDSIKELRVLSP